MKSLRMLKQSAVMVGRHSEIAMGLEVPCRIIFKAQPHMLARLQAYFQFEFANRWEGAYRSMGT